MRLLRPRLFAALLLLMVPLVGLAWWIQVNGQAAPAAPRSAASTLPPPTVKAETQVTPSAAATPGHPPSLTPIPTQTSPAVPSTTPTLSPTPSLTPSITSTPVDRSCPDPPPARPVYQQPVVSKLPWPTPDAAASQPHFWLSAPALPSAGQLRYGEQFPYGWDGGGRYLLHNGIDVIEPQGVMLLAVAEGTVVVAGEDADTLYGWRCNWYGRLVVLELDQHWRGQPVYVLYGHVLNMMVQPGERVSAGQPVAEIGFGGVATAAHLHFEVRVGSNEFDFTRNPMLWLAPETGRGVVAGRLLDPGGRAWHGVPVTLIGRSENTSYRTTWTYLDDPRRLANPDEGWAENFVLPNLPPGRYELYIPLQGVTYGAFVQVVAGAVSAVEIITEAYRTPTPTPRVTPTPAPTPGLDSTPEQTATAEGGS